MGSSCQDVVMLQVLHIIFNFSKLSYIALMEWAFMWRCDHSIDHKRESILITNGNKFQCGIIPRCHVYSLLWSSLIVFCVHDLGFMQSVWMTKLRSVEHYHSHAGSALLCTEPEPSLWNRVMDIKVYLQEVTHHYTTSKLKCFVHEYYLRMKREYWVMEKY